MSLKTGASQFRQRSDVTVQNDGISRSLLLNRPQALNALNFEMVRFMTERLMVSHCHCDSLFVSNLTKWPWGSSANAAKGNIY